MKFQLKQRRFCIQTDRWALCIFVQKPIKVRSSESASSSRKLCLELLLPSLQASLASLSLDCVHGLYSISSSKSHVHSSNSTQQSRVAFLVDYDYYFLLNYLLFQVPQISHGCLKSSDCNETLSRAGYLTSWTSKW